MKILHYGLNYSPEITGIGKYSGEKAEWLARQGHEVRIVCAPPYYPEWSIGDNYKSWRYVRESINSVSVFRCPLYIPKQPRMISRLVHLCSYALSSSPIILKQFFWRPDVVITVEPTFFCTPMTLLLAKLSGAKSVLHVQDFELDAMLGLGMGNDGLLARFSHFIESLIMRRFDAITSISYSMVNKADVKTRHSPSASLFPNWVDIDFVTPATDASTFRARWNISPKTKVVLYSGNMGKKQGLELVIEAANSFREQSDVLFILVGTGAAFPDLNALAADLNLPNMHFYPLQDYQDLPSLMALADVHLVVQKKGVADAVLPSKLTTIFSAGGTALITAEDNTELGLLCKNYPGIAKRVEPECIDAFIEALSELLSAVDVNNRVHNQIARDYAVNHLSKEVILRQYEQDLMALCQ